MFQTPTGVLIRSYLRMVWNFVKAKPALALWLLFIFGYFVWNFLLRHNASLGHLSPRVSGIFLGINTSLVLYPFFRRRAQAELNFLAQNSRRRDYRRIFVLKMLSSQFLGLMFIQSLWRSRPPEPMSFILSLLLTTIILHTFMRWSDRKVQASRGWRLGAYVGLHLLPWWRETRALLRALAYTSWRGRIEVLLGSYFAGIGLMLILLFEIDTWPSIWLAFPPLAGISSLVAQGVADISFLQRQRWDWYKHWERAQLIRWLGFGFVFITFSHVLQGILQGPPEGGQVLVSYGLFTLLASPLILLSIVVRARYPEQNLVRLFVYSLNLALLPLMPIYLHYTRGRLYDRD